MKRSSILFALGFAIAGCGARSELYDNQSEGAAAGPHIYVADDTIPSNTPGGIYRMDDLDGTHLLSFLGDGSSFLEPCGPAIDGEGTIYFIDVVYPHILSMSDITGADLKVFGSLGTEAGQFTGLSGTAVDAEGRIYVSDGANNRIARIDDMSGSGWVSLGGLDSGLSPGEFDRPEGIAVSASGKILVADTLNHRIVQMDDMTGAGWATWDVPAGPKGLASPSGVAFDSEERLYAVDFESSVLHRLDNIAGDGHVSFSDPKLIQMSHVTVDEHGRIYLTLLNGLETILSMDGMGGENLKIYANAPDDGRKLKGPCGIVVR